MNGHLTAVAAIVLGSFTNGAWLIQGGHDVAGWVIIMFGVFVSLGLIGHAMKQP